MVANERKNPLFMSYVLLMAAVVLSTVAEYYAIVGLMAIFAGAQVAVAVMGATLGVSKIVITSWLYRNWKETPVLMRLYFTMAIMVLMLLTSMGIFGFLSKAHVDSNLVGGDSIYALSVIDEKLKTERENIDANRRTLSQLDTQVNEAISRTSETDTNGAGVNRSVNIRKAQAAERQSVQESILSSQSRIAKLNEERAPLAAKVREVEAEVGPIKYIAQLIYGQDSTNQSTIESAIRWVIILIVSVFDPLAVLMFIAVNQTLRSNKTKEIQSSITDSVNLIKEEIKEEIQQLDTSLIKPIRIKTKSRMNKLDDKIEVDKPKKPRRVRKTKLNSEPIMTDKVEWERDRVLVPVEEKITTDKS